MLIAHVRARERRSVGVMPSRNAVRPSVRSVGVMPPRIVERCGAFPRVVSRLSARCDSQRRLYGLRRSDTVRMIACRAERASPGRATSWPAVGRPLLPGRPQLLAIPSGPHARGSGHLSAVPSGPSVRGIGLRHVCARTIVRISCLETPISMHHSPVSTAPVIRRPVDGGCVSLCA